MKKLYKRLPNNIEVVSTSTKTYFDKINGNSYFNNKITIYYKDGTEKTHFTGMQYGYSRQYETSILDFLSLESERKNPRLQINTPYEVKTQRELKNMLF